MSGRGSFKKNGFNAQQVAIRERLSSFSEESLATGVTQKSAAELAAYALRHFEEAIANGYVPDERSATMIKHCRAGRGTRMAGRAALSILLKSKGLEPVPTLKSKRMAYARRRARESTARFEAMPRPLKPPGRQ